MRTMQRWGLVAASVVGAVVAVGYVSDAQEADPGPIRQLDLPWVALTRAERLIGSWRATQATEPYTLELRADGTAVYSPQGRPTVTCGWEYSGEALRFLRVDPANASLLVSDNRPVLAVTREHVMALPPVIAPPPAGQDPMAPESGGEPAGLLPGGNLYLQRMR